MRVVVMALIVSLFSGAAAAADRYVEVWNPPEASGKSQHKQQKPAAAKTPKHAGAKHAPKSAKVASGKTKPQKSAKNTSKEAQQPGKPKVQRAAGKTVRTKPATKSAGASTVRTKPAATGHALPPILS